jgi:hypothetical protein
MNFAEKIKIHNLMFKFFFFGYPTFYEIRWKNIVEPDKPQNSIIRRVRFSC